MLAPAAADHAHDFDVRRVVKLDPSAPQEGARADRRVGTGLSDLAERAQA